MGSNFLCSKERCTGCLTCYNSCTHGAIFLIEDKEGFVFPKINNDVCVGCGLCEKVCPEISPVEKSFAEPEVYAGWIKNKRILRRSSSGGIFSAVAKYALKENGVVFGAAFDNKFEVKHRGISREDELHCLRGSKYVQSFIGESYKNVKDCLSRGVFTLFSGTPCQIAGLISYLKYQKCDCSKLVTIDLVCHGVPSPMIFKEYIKNLENESGATLKHYTFRDKKWSWFKFNTKATLSNGKIIYGTWEEDPFMRGFLRNYFLRKSCYSCPYAAKERLSDITLCDYWGYQKFPSEIDNKDHGVSLILLHTDKAKRIFNEIKSEFFYYPRDFLEAIRSNPAFRSPFPAPLDRDVFWADFDHLPFTDIKEKYFYPESIPSLLARRYKYGRAADSLIHFCGKIKRKCLHFINPKRYLAS